MTRPSPTRYLLGPAVLALGPLVMNLIAAWMGSTYADPTGFMPFMGYAVAFVTAPALLGWRMGEVWARNIAWGVAVLLMAISLFALAVGVWMFGYYENPIGDLPLNIGVPAVGILGCGLILWAVLRPPRAGQTEPA